MADDEKAELFRQIMLRNDDHFILERMRSLGFWADGEDLPEDPPEERAERAAIEEEIKQLRKQHAALQDPEKALAAERIRRWEESKLRRAAAKAECEKQLQQRREAYQQYRQQTVVHAGDGLSAGLQNARSDADRLTQQGLPVLHRSEELAAAMAIPLSQLRWLTYHRRATTVVHYRRYDIAKKSGGVRCISAPIPKLDDAQVWVLENILRKLTPEPQAHGFVRGRSIVTNAAGHVGKRIVINMDLQNFFPSIGFRRVKGLFQKFGYSEHLAITLALLTTEPPRVAVENQHRNRVYFVALGDRVLPQGACTSPAITNLLSRRLDRRLRGLAAKHEFHYTRYADDLTFSGHNGAAVGRLLKSARSVVADEGFQVNEEKTRVMRCGGQQEVTGLTVNEKLSVGRKELRRLRAILHNARRTGLESQNREGIPNFVPHLWGKILYIHMVDPAKARPLRQALEQLLREGQSN